MIGWDRYRSYHAEVEDLADSDDIEVEGNMIDQAIDEMYEGKEIELLSVNWVLAEDDRIGRMGRMDRADEHTDGVEDIPPGDDEGI